MKKFISLIVLSILVVACTSVPVNNQFKAASELIAFLALEIDSAEQVGQISREKEKELLLKLREANSQLRTAEGLLDTCVTDCPDPSSSINDINQILRAVEIELRRSAQ